MPTQHLHARKERSEVHADHIFDRHEVTGPTRRHPARKRLGHLHACEMLVPVVRIAHPNRERERQVGDVGEWVPRIDGKRREHRKHLRLEERIDHQPFRRREFVHAYQVHAMRRQRRQQVVGQAATLHVQHLVHALVDARQQFRR